MLTGENNGFIELHDIQKVCSVRIFRNHYFRVGCIEVDLSNQSLFYSGSKDYEIHLNDLRERKPGILALKSHRS